MLVRAREIVDIHVTGTMELLDGRTRASNARRSKKCTIFDFLNQKNLYWVQKSFKSQLKNYENARASTRDRSDIHITSTMELLGL